MHLRDPNRLPEGVDQPAELHLEGFDRGADGAAAADEVVDGDEVNLAVFAGV
jgi:hypothetical protein